MSDDIEDDEGHDPRIWGRPSRGISSLESQLAESVRERDEHKQWRVTLDEALTISANRSATLQSQRDEARAKLERAERELGLVRRDLDDMADAARLESAQAAAMREALEKHGVRHYKFADDEPGEPECTADCPACATARALAPDAGRRYVEIAKAAAAFFDDYADGCHHPKGCAERVAALRSALDAR